MRLPSLGIPPFSVHSHFKRAFLGQKTWLYLNSQDIGLHR